MATQTHTSTHHSTAAEKPSMLKTVLRANAIFSDLSGAVMLLLAGRIATFTGIQPPLVFTIMGAVLLGFALLIWLATRDETNIRRFGTAILIADVLWVLASIVVLVTGVLPLTLAGKWAVAIIADIVGVFAVAEFIGLRRLN